MSDGTHAAGTTLAGSTCGTIGNITSITVGDITVDVIDISTMDSTNNWREFISGLKDAGEFSGEINYDGSAAGVADSLNTALGLADDFDLIFPDTSKMQCVGFLKSWNISGEHTDKLKSNFSIKLSSAPTFTDVA